MALRACGLASAHCLQPFTITRVRFTLNDKWGTNMDNQEWPDHEQRTDWALDALLLAEMTGWLTVGLTAFWGAFRVVGTL